MATEKEQILHQAALRRASRKFIEAFAAVLNVNPPFTSDFDLACQVAVALNNANVLTNRKPITDRTVYRWCCGGPLLRRKTFDAIVEKLVAITPSEKADKIAALSSAFAGYRTIEQRQMSVGASAVADASNVVLGLDESTLASFLETQNENHLRWKKWCVAIPIPARCTEPDRDQPSAAPWVDHVEDTVDFLRVIVSRRSKTMVRVAVVADAGRGKSLVTTQLQSRLYDSYNLRFGESPSTVPIRVSWSRWYASIQEVADEIVHLRSDRLALLAKKLLAISDINVESELALDMLQNSSVTVILEDVFSRVPTEILDELPNEAKNTVTEFHRSIARLIISGNHESTLESLLGEKEWKLRASSSRDIGSFTHILTLGQLDRFSVAAQCRKSISSLYKATLDELAGLGESILSLAYPGVAGRTLALIESGDLDQSCLESDTVLHASLYLADLKYRLAMSRPLLFLEQCGKPWGIPPTTEDRRGPDQILLPKILEYIQEDIDLNSRKGSRLTRTDGSWVFTETAKAKDFLFLYLSNTTMSKTDRVHVLDLADEGGCLLFARRNTSSVQALKKGKLEWQEIIERMNSKLENKPSFQAVSDGWPQYLSSLGYLRGKWDIEDVSVAALWNKTYDTLRSVFLDRTTSGHSGLISLRYFCAKAVAIILNRKELATRLDTLRVNIEGKTNPRKSEGKKDSLGIALELLDTMTFLGEATCHWYAHGDSPIASSQKKAIEDPKTQILELLKLTLLFNREKPNEDSGHLRHARYHLWEALIRISSPTDARAHLRELVDHGQFFKSWPSLPLSFRSIECATAVGALVELGEFPPFKANEVASKLVRFSIKEVQNAELWKKEDSQGTGLNLHIKSHLFFAFRRLCPLMCRHERKKLIDNRELKYLEKSEIDEVGKEEGYIRWMYSWLRQEINDGIYPHRDTIKLFEILAGTPAAQKCVEFIQLVEIMK